MKSSVFNFFIFFTALASMPLNAKSDVLNRSVSYPHASQDKLTPVVKANTHARSDARSSYFLVNDSEPYKGSNLIINRRKFETTRNGINYSGFYFLFGDLLILWDGEKPHLQFISIEAAQDGMWKSCWSDNASSARACDSDSDLVYIFSEENAAIAFASDTEQSDQQPSSLEGDEPSEPETNFASVTCEASPGKLKAALLQITNESRSQSRSCGTDAFTAAPALVWNDALAQAAEKHSLDMARNNFFSHTGSDGLEVWDRSIAQGYRYRYIGENIAAGQRSVNEVQNGWTDSPSHCANIMQQEIVEMGAACVVNQNSDYLTYWTVVVGKPR